MSHSHKPFAYFGTPYVARDTLATLLERGYVPSVVVTSPDSPQGRGLTLQACPTKIFALEQNLPVLTPEKLDSEFREALATYGCEYAIVVAYGKIIPRALIEQFPIGLVNVHYSLLPKYRGASPVESALLHGETVTGVSIQKMVFELDAGDVLATREIAIGPTETTRELRPRLIEAGSELLVETLPAFEAGTIEAVPQDESDATHFGKIDKREGELSLSGDARTNWNKYRAYAESPGTYFFMERDGKRLRVKIKTATLENERFVPERVVPEGKGETDFTNLLSSGWSAV